MIGALTQAVDTLRRLSRLWVWHYLARLILALLISLPLLATLPTSLDHSRFGQILAGEWSIDVITELVLTRENLLEAALFFTFFMALAALFLKQFLNGGIYQAIVSRRMPSAADFFRFCGQDFGGHVRISLIMLPIYAGLFLIASVVSAVIPPALFGHFGVSGFLSLAAPAAIFWPFLIIGSIFSDLLRLSFATRSGERVADLWRVAFGRFRVSGVQAIGVYAMCFVPFVLLWIVLELLAVRITGSLQNGLGVTIEFMLFQFCALARSAQSLLGTSGIAALQETRRSPVPSPTIEAAPLP